MIPTDLKERREMISNMIAFCQTLSNLTKWEEDFIASVDEQFGNRGNLSDRQCEILEKIYEKD